MLRINNHLTQEAYFRYADATALERDWVYTKSALARRIAKDRRVE